jgi:arginine:ornithine antiporter/lysine permease
MASSSSQRLSRDLAFAAIAAICTILMIWAGGDEIPALGGGALCAWDRPLLLVSPRAGRQTFTRIEMAIFVILVLGGAAGVYGLASG